MMVNVFAVPVFFICFRECLETSIVISVLLAFLKQTLGGQDRDVKVYKRLVRQVWWGVAGGIFICAAVGGGMIAAFYVYGRNHFAGTENIWEGCFGIIASIIISVMGAALLRISKLQIKWRAKLSAAFEAKDGKGTAGNRFKRWCEKYAMFMLPFITCLREGLEGIVFVAGVGLSMPATAVPLAVVCGLGAGFLVGYLIYRGGNAASLQVFLIVSTCFLYLVAAGLLSRSVWFFEADAWNKIVGGDAAEAGAGPGSYDIRQSVWHLNYGSPRLNGGGGWGVFNAIFGWQNSATYGSVISYNLYWLVVIVAFLLMRYRETKGHLPFMKSKERVAGSESDTSSEVEKKYAGKEGEQEDLAVGIREFKV